MKGKKQTCPCSLLAGEVPPAPQRSQHRHLEERSSTCTDAQFLPDPIDIAEPHSLLGCVM